MSAAASTEKASIASEGRLAENVVYFARTLRDAGVKVGPAAAMDAVRAIQAGGVSHRDDFYWTLHAILVTRREDHAVFDEAFRLFWRSRDLIEKMIHMFSPMANPKAEPEAAKAAAARVAEALFSGEDRRQEIERPEFEVDASFTFSGREVLRDKDFAQMSAAEIAVARRAIAGLVLPDDTVRTRRFRTAPRGERLDPRQMMRRSLATGGDLVLPVWKERRSVHPPVVVLADISGSMSQYSRVFLHFVHALASRRKRVHAFLFGTRLTNVTRQLRAKDPDEALADVAGTVADWEGGTRIGDTLRRFNREWSRRVLGQGAIVILMTDGLERAANDDEIAELARETERLRKSCRRLIWLNPLLRFEGFEARAAGIRAMRPHVDDFRTVHSLEALSGLCEALADRGARSIRRAA